MSSASTNPSFALLHEIFVLDAHLEQALNMEKHESITRELVGSLLAAMRMIDLGPLQIYTATDDRAPGWSFIQPITTSHISGHYFEKPGRQPHIRMDFYSCDSVDWQKIIKICHERLKLADWRANFIDREIEIGKPRDMFEANGYGDAVTEKVSLEPQSPRRMMDKLSKELIKGTKPTTQSV